MLKYKSGLFKQKNQMSYGKKLTEEEIAERMVELYNLRKAHKHDRQQITQQKMRINN